MQVESPIQVSEDDMASSDAQHAVDV